MPWQSAIALPRMRRCTTDIKPAMVSHTHANSNNLGRLSIAKELALVTNIVGKGSAAVTGKVGDAHF